MKQLHLGIGLIVWLLAVGISVPAVAQQQDEPAIRQLQVWQAAAWNQHDARAYAKLFAEDGDMVNAVGWWWRGRPEIERKLSESFGFVFAQSVLTITDVDVRFLSPSMAVAHVRWTMVGAKASPSMPEPREGIQLQILTKQPSGWLIASLQNTNSVPVTPLPKGPAPAGDCYHCLASSQFESASSSDLVSKGLPEPRDGRRSLSPGRPSVTTEMGHRIG